jgi:ADP-ribose pyrophosphatase YjhB (NUDIX family)
LSLPTKRSIAVLITKDNLVLSTRRYDADDELPGIWGLPAGSYRDLETLEQLIARIGRDKLGVTLTPKRKLAEGRQHRDRYILDMELWEAEMSGAPQHPVWRWTTPDTLFDGSRQGSLCCSLALQLLKS